MPRRPVPIRRRPASIMGPAACRRAKPPREEGRRARGGPGVKGKERASTDGGATDRGAGRARCREVTAPPSANKPCGSTALGRVWLAQRTPSAGLDWLNLFVANIQTGFGPFISVYLTTQGRTLTAIGFPLTPGPIPSKAHQRPARPLADPARSTSRRRAVSTL